MLHDCDAEVTEFLKVMDALHEKLGPLLLQFGYFNRSAFAGVNDFLARLKPFLKELPSTYHARIELILKQGNFIFASSLQNVT
jgi:uncharacterized protein YecE (DUF72 family)